MLNAEKYRDEIFKRAENNRKDFYKNTYPLSLAVDEICKSGLTLEKTIEWLLSEYEPPFLENGDNLKPGDWIMVTNWKDEKPSKRQFICYKDGKFYTVNCGGEIENSCVYVGWRFARLPEEGE